MFRYKIIFKWGNSIIIRATTPKEASQWIIKHYLTDEFHMKCVRN